MSSFEDEARKIAARHAAEEAAFLADQRHAAEASAALRKVRALQDRARAAEGATGPELIALALTVWNMTTQTDLARASGLTANTITALKKGKRPTAAQRAAILWAIARHEIGGLG